MSLTEKQRKRQQVKTLSHSSAEELAYLTVIPTYNSASNTYWGHRKEATGTRKNGLWYSNTSILNHMTTDQHCNTYDYMTYYMGKSTDQPSLCHHAVQ